MRTIFLDTVGLLALWDRSDQWHAAASAAYRLLIASPVRLVASSLVLFECGNAAARRPYRSDVYDLWAAMDAAGELLRPSEDQIARAWTNYASQPSGSAGIVDHISFVLMIDANISEAFTNDVHFRTAGFITLF